MDDRAQPQRKEKKEAEAQAAADLIARFKACQAKCVCIGPCGVAGLKGSRAILHPKRTYLHLPRSLRCLTLVRV